MKLKRSFAGVLAFIMLASVLLSGCQSEPGEPFLSPAAPTAAPTEATVPETEPPTEPQPTAPADGNPDDITCKGSYTGNAMTLSESKETAVATIGKEALSNGLLQIYYQMAVQAYQAASHEVAPDFTQPLDVQLCPIEGTATTWQQYFLEQALKTWQSHYAMVQRSKKEVLPLEEAYGRDQAEHDKHQIKNIYNLKLLYGYNADYVISDAHQAYLDNLPNLLAELATAKECASPAALTSRFAGVGTNDTYLLEYAQLLNEGYMFMTSLSYYVEPTVEEITAYLEENLESYTQQGISAGSSNVNLRHILVVPEEATLAEDGTVTASDEAWAAAKKEAEDLLKKWNKNKTEDYFAELAFANSDDTGSSVVGGLYSNISKGQLMAELDAWCFDEARNPGDVEIVKTALGYHILYLSQPTDTLTVLAEQDLIARCLEEEIGKTVADYPVTVDYSKIFLDEVFEEDFILSASELLYPDIAHERFPVAPLYFQQDYPDTMYGNYPLVRYGCGVTTMAMLVTYMTDEEWTPPELCALYGDYCTDKGTAHAMFTDVPIDNSFFSITRVFTWKEALSYLEQGYMVVTLQRNGYWTNGGHYLLLHNLIEAENDEGVVETRIQVRDSNVKNYKKLKGHVSGSFALSTIPGNSRCYWVYQKKVTNLDSCARCAAPTAESHTPSALFAEDYICSKCAVAVNRRDAYLTGCVEQLVPVQIPVPEETVPAETETPEGTEPVATEAAKDEPDPAEPDPETVPTETETSAETEASEETAVPTETQA